MTKLHTYNNNMESDTLCTVVDVSLASSQLQIPFSTNPGALTIIQCVAAVRYIGCIIMLESGAWTFPYMIVVQYLIYGFMI